MINFKKISQIIFYIAILLSQVNAKSVNELLSILENSEAQMQYIFWQDGSAAFLSNIVPAGEKPSIWRLTSERKWQPLYNAGAFDGFPAAGDTFDSVSLDPDTKQVIVGNVNQQTALPDASVDPMLKLLENKTYAPKHYFWNEVVDGENVPFLATTKEDGSNAVWHLTTEGRKWQPLVNADAFDGFPEASDTVSDLKIDIKRGSLKAGKRNEEKIKEMIEEKYQNEEYREMHREKRQGKKPIGSNDGSKMGEDKEEHQGDDFFDANSSKMGEDKEEHQGMEEGQAGFDQQGQERRQEMEEGQERHQQSSGSKSSGKSSGARRNRR